MSVDGDVLANGGQGSTPTDSNASEKPKSGEGDGEGATSASSSGSGEKLVSEQELDAVKASLDKALEKLQALEAENDNLKKEKLSDQERAVLEAADSVRKELTPELEDLKKTMESYLQKEIDSIPEDKRDLIPDLPVKAKLEWLKSAKEKGLFDGKPSSTSAIPASSTPSGNASAKPEAGTKEYNAFVKSKYGISMPNERFDKFLK